MDDTPSASELFNAYYYAHDCGEPYERNEVWLSRFDAIAERIVLDIQPATVLDAGCALGLLVEVLRKRGVQAWGIDISEFAIQNVHPDISPFCRIGSISKPFELPHYDLIVSIEVLEHLPKEDTDTAIANLCQHSDDILFSSTPYDYHEATHFNVQPSEYWVEKFARHGFFRDVDFDASFLTNWAILFRRKKLSLSHLARDYERRFMPLLNENVVLRKQVINNRDHLEHNERHILQLEQKDQELVTQLGESQHQLELAGQRIAGLEQHIVGLEQHIAGLEQSIAKLEQGNADSKLEQRELQTQLNSAETRLAELTQEKQDLAQQLAEAQQRQATAENRISELENVNQTLAFQLESIHGKTLYKLYRAFRHPFKK